MYSPRRDTSSSILLLPFFAPFVAAVAEASPFCWALDVGCSSFGGAGGLGGGCPISTMSFHLGDGFSLVNSSTSLLTSS